MDAGACAADRSSYATGGEGLGNQEWEWGDASKRAWATRRIHGGRCPVGRRSREGVGFCESEDSYERGLGKSRLQSGTGSSYCESYKQGQGVSRASKSLLLGRHGLLGHRKLRSF